MLVREEHVLLCNMVKDCFCVCEVVKTVKNKTNPLQLFLLSPKRWSEKKQNEVFYTVDKT